jgi:NDP-sugar pyrophosphorylase family protein
MSDKKNKIKSWYSNRYQIVVVQRNVLLLLTIVSIIVVAIAIGFVKNFMSSKSLEPYIIEIDDKSFVQKFSEKSATSHSNIANSAIYMFKDKSLSEIYKLSRHENDISQHLIPKLIGSIKAFPLSGKFIDIGIPERYLKSNL